MTALALKRRRGNWRGSRVRTTDDGALIRFDGDPLGVLAILS